MATNMQDPQDPAVEAAANPSADAERVIKEQRVIADGHATTTAVEETTVVVPSAATIQRRRLTRARRTVYTIVNILAIFVTIRFVIALLGADPENAFASFIYGITFPFLLPFENLFGPEADPALGRNVFELSSLVAIAIYYLLAWIAVKVATLVYLRTRSEPAEAGTAV